MSVSARLRLSGLLNVTLRRWLAQVTVIGAAAVLLLQVAGTQVLAAEPIEEIQVIGITPDMAARQALRKVPYAVQSAGFADLDAAQSLDVSDFMNARLGSVSINSAQNNPLQADVQFRGFTASPLLGLPQGISVYQNGVRINEPLGDAVNWDLVPESAVYGMQLLSGSNPVFGLNTLGGALSLTMKNGFNFVSNQAEVSTGSWERVTGTVESGGNHVGKNGAWGYYANLSGFDEAGWRDLSASTAQNFYGTLGWRNSERSALDLTYQLADSDLIGNGALPIGLIALQREAVFTAPDITANAMQMFDFSGSHLFNAVVQFSGNAFWRENTTDSFNGDGSEFELCVLPDGSDALFEDGCNGEDITDELSGTGVLSDAALNNISWRKQESSGVNGQFVFTHALFARPNQFVTGYSWFKGESTFESVLELAELDPVTRSTEGLGTGTFLDEAATDINTATETVSWYFTNTIDLTAQLALTISGRYNDTDVTLRDQSGERPELNGDHNFARFNPALGFAFSPDAATTVYGSYSESSRVPTPIELACNEGVFELAQQFAIEEGKDPDDIEFECRLPNAFLADPPLEDVVTRSVEIGMRGTHEGLRYQMGLFRAVNKDDILFQTTGRSTGLFANVDKTQRQGVELSLAGTVERINWYAAYTFIEATFADDFEVLSPNHPNADGDGELDVQAGDRISGLPENIVKLGGDFSLNQTLSVGAELVYNSNQVMRGDESNDLEKVDGYTLVNFNATYAFAERFTVFARVTNVFDKDYENFGLLGEDPDEILPDLEDDRPLFLGVGAPRAAWIGLRLRY